MAHEILNPAPVALKRSKMSNTLNLMFTSALGAFLGRILGFLKITVVLFQREICTSVTCPWSRTAKLPNLDKSRKFSPHWTNSRLISPSSTHSLSTQRAPSIPIHPVPTALLGYTSSCLWRAVAKMYHSLWIFNIEMECMHSIVCIEMSHHMA